MATTETTSTLSRERIALLSLLGCVFVIGGCVLFYYLNRPPQMGTSEEVFNTVDALYTAVRNEDEKRVSDCEMKLHAYREEGKLPADAADALDAIIRKARSGAWETAARQLYEFMRAQRREGPIEPHHRERGKKSPGRESSFRIGLASVEA